MIVLGVRGVDLKLIKLSRHPMILALLSKSPKRSLHLEMAHTTCQVSVKHSYKQSYLHCPYIGTVETEYLPQVTVRILVKIVIIF